MSITVKQGFYQGNTYYILRYALAFLTGLVLGAFNPPDQIYAVCYVGLCIMTFFAAAQSNLQSFFMMVPYLVYAEIVIRPQGHYIPYLLPQYALTACFGMQILRRGILMKIHSRAFIFLLLFAFIEIIDNFRTVAPDYSRFVTISTILLTVTSVWASSNILTPRLLIVLMNNLKIAAIFVCGNILAAHLRGDINYGLASNFDSTNGLAPVQISAYLGLSSILFFLSIMNNEERKMLLIHIILFIVSASLMLLSFSRGGFYFLIAIISIYFLFNFRKAGSYYILLLLIPIGFLIYYYVTETTGGVIEDRYQQEGTSNRGELIEAGIKIFQADPLAGVGTGNFGDVIVERDLYGVNSGAHNEFVRVAAEHGILGIITYYVFFIVLFFEILGRRKIQRDFGIYFLVLFCLILVHNGLKIILQPVILMIVLATPSVTKMKRKSHVQHLPEPGV